MAVPSISMTLAGEKQLLRSLKRLKARTVKTVVVGASRESMKPMTQAAKANARSIKDTGLLAKSIGAISRRYRSGNVSVVVGPRTGHRQVIDGTPRDPSKYGHLVEFGTRPHLIKITRGPFAGRTISHPGSPPRSFMRKAYTSKQAVVFGRFGKLLEKRIANAVEKAKR